MSTIDESTAVTVPGNALPSRLSFVFEDRSGCLKGVTLRRLVSVRPPPPFGPPCEARSPVLQAGTNQRLGFLDPDLSIDELSSDYQAPPEIMPSALLSSIFTIDLDQRDLSPVFFLERDNIRFAEPSELVGTNLVVAGEKAPAGKLRGSLDFLSWNDLRIYPLLRLERSRFDLDSRKDRLRNGAMVKTEGGALVGLVASMSADARYYSLVPISSVTELYGLTFARMRQNLSEDVKKAATVTPPKDPNLRFLASSLAELVGAE